MCTQIILLLPPPLSPSLPLSPPQSLSFSLSLSPPLSCYPSLSLPLSFLLPFCLCCSLFLPIPKFLSVIECIQLSEPGMTTLICSPRVNLVDLPLCIFNDFIQVPCKAFATACSLYSGKKYRKSRIFRAIIYRVKKIFGQTTLYRIIFNIAHVFSRV